MICTNYADICVRIRRINRVWLSYSLHTSSYDSAALPCVRLVDFTSARMEFPADGGIFESCCPRPGRGFYPW